MCLLGSTDGLSRDKRLVTGDTTALNALMQAHSRLNESNLFIQLYSNMLAINILKRHVSLLTASSLDLWITGPRRFPHRQFDVMLLFYGAGMAYYTFPHSNLLPAPAVFHAGRKSRCLCRAPGLGGKAP